MRIETIFKRDIFRAINGVVKADQLDPSSVWQELDEFVVTHEMDGHLRRFFSTYLDALSRPKDADVTGKIGVWVSGFFGSGKSHFIKVLSYLLENKEHVHEGESKRAIDFFKSKIDDAMFMADMGRAVDSGTDVLLFNIDSKADNRAGRDAILLVFLKVLNERQGYSPDYPHIANMERYLDGKGKLEAFHAAYARLSGASWLEERDAYAFNRDQVLDALAEVLGQSRQSLEKWVDNAEDNFPLTVENFAKWTRAYLDAQGPGHRVVFLVDEIGQFIGGDTHLMLNLQTIVEGLGTHCEGRAWVVVTSQEDIDAVLGDVKASRNDFSKIQGRFATRLSLSSANVDEVIQQRLLAKVDDATEELAALFAIKGNIVKNQLTFSNIGMTFKPLRDAEDFAVNYPFVPYQFKLLQKIFESIRKVGATGLHLAQGERSLLDAFQSAAKQVAHEETGVFIPLYRFYPAIESFLDTSVKRTIDHARDNPGLEAFDSDLLKVLFLIRYVDEIRGNVDNLVTLCTDRIDADRHALRRHIEESLQRLEKETLINRNGNLYQFLTNEERDINREIKTVDLNTGDEAKLLGDVLFEDVLKGQRKYRFTANNMDFTFNRLCDLFPMGNRTEGAISVSVISPLNYEYDQYGESKCILESSNDNGQVVIRLRNDERLGRELRDYLRTDKYVRTKDDGSLPAGTKSILRALAEENRSRRERLVLLLGEMIAEADYFVAGSPFTPKSGTFQGILAEALEYLITNTFTKMALIAHLNDAPAQEIQAVLRSNDIGQQSLALELPESNPDAIKDIRQYIDLCTRTSRQIVLYDMITGRYGQRPYGWPDMEVALLIARLLVLGEIQLVAAGDVVPHGKLYDILTTPSHWRKTQVIQRKTADPAAIQKARNIAKDVFSQMAPDGEDALTEHIRSCAAAWLNSLQQWKSLADTGHYPGGDDIAEGLGIMKNLLACDDSRKLVERFDAQEKELRDFADAYADLRQLYEYQKQTWEKLRDACQRFQQNRLELDRDADAAPALRRMNDILNAPAPYALIREADGLIQQVAGVNDALVTQRRSEVLAALQKTMQQMTAETDTARADAALKQACLAPLETLAAQTARLESIAHLTQAEQEAERLFDTGMKRLEVAAAATPPEGKAGETETPKVKPRRIIKPSEMIQKSYLETEDEVETFVGNLKEAMVEAIKRGERIQVK